MSKRLANLKRNLSSAYLALSVSLSFLLLACSEPPPIKLGFVGSLTGKMSDLGVPARNGMLMAIEETNEQGGINGRTIESIIKDDKQKSDVAKAVTTELLEAKVDAIIGPVTSTMAMSVVDLANANQTLMAGVTVGTNELNFLDDYFFRGIASNSTHAAMMAEYLYNLGLRKSAGVYDLANVKFSQDWLGNFSSAFKKLGGHSVNELEFHSGESEELLLVADALLQNDPDLIVLVTNALDSALLAKLIRERNPTIQIASSAWAATDRFLELGGRHIEGTILPMYYDRSDKSPAYLTFKQNYLKRFKVTPDLGSVIAYNITNYVLHAIEIKAPNQNLKQAALGIKDFQGVQGPLMFDKYGDIEANNFISMVRHGVFSSRGSL